MNRPQISIVIINYNTFDLTCKCIQSIFAKTNDCTYEIILVDNASTETSPEKFEELFPSVVFIRSDVNLGFSKGNNLGIAKARGEVVLLLNSDTELENDAISICYKTLVSDAKTAVVSSGLKYPDGELQHNCQRFPSIRYKLFELFRLQKIFPRATGGKILLGFFFNHAEVVSPDWVWGTFFMFKKNLLELLPEKKLADDFFMYVEDMQWCMDFYRLGYKIVFQPAAQVIHFMGKSGGAKSNLMTENMNKFMQRYYQPWEVIMIRWLDRILTR